MSNECIMDKSDYWYDARKMTNANVENPKDEISHFIPRNCKVGVYRQSRMLKP